MEETVQFRNRGNLSSCSDSELCGLRQVLSPSAGHSLLRPFVLPLHPYSLTSKGQTALSSPILAVPDFSET